MKANYEFSITGLGNNPGVAGLRDGGYVLAWNAGDMLQRTNIYAARYNINDVKVSSTIYVNPEVPSKGDFAITGLSDGGFAVTWSDLTSTPVVMGNVYAKHFYNNNTAGPIINVNSHRSGAQGNPSITSLENGNFAITWLDFRDISDTPWKSFYENNTAGYVYAKQYTINNKPVGDEFLVQSSAEIRFYDHPSIVSLKDGSYIVACCSKQPAVNHFDSNNKLLDNGTLSHYKSSSIKALSNGGYINAWSEHSKGSQDCASYSLHTQSYYANNSKTGDETVVLPNSYINSFAITALKNGGQALVWSGSCPTIGDEKYNIFGMASKSNSGLTTVNLKISNDLPTDKFYPSVASLESGGFIAAWEVGKIESTSTGTSVFPNLTDTRTVHAKQFMLDDNIAISSTGVDVGSTGSHHQESSTGGHSISSGLESYYLDEMTVLVTLAGSILYQTYNMDFFDN